MIGAWGNAWGLARPTPLQQLQQQVGPLSTGGREGPTLDSLQPAATSLDTSGGRGSGIGSGGGGSAGGGSSSTSSNGSNTGTWFDPEVWNPLMSDPNQGRPSVQPQGAGQMQPRVNTRWGIIALLVLGSAAAAFGAYRLLGGKKRRRSR